MTKENKPERIVILSKARGPRFEHIFFKEIQAAILDGYRVADTNLLADRSMRNYRGRIGRAVMYLEGSQPERYVEKRAAEVLPEKESTSEEPPVLPEAKNKSSGKIDNKPVEKKEEEVKTPDLPQIDALDTVKDMKAFADKHGIKLPSSATTKKLIKKALVAALDS